MEVLAEMMSRIDKGARTIDALLDFTGEYEKIGLTEPVWLEVPRLFKEGVMGLDTQRITASLDLDGLEILGDPMFSKVFRNLADNTLRHGEKATRISVSYEVRPDGLVITYEDDGVGITKEARAKLFQRGYGKNTGLGLYLTKEILDSSGMIIRETSVPGSGVRFEMLVPNGKFRFHPVHSA
jgi:signal transduction histidine kinase